MTDQANQSGDDLEGRLSDTKRQLEQARKANQALATSYEQNAQQTAQNLTHYFSDTNDELVNHVLETAMQMEATRKTNDRSAKGQAIAKHGQTSIETLDGLKADFTYNVNITDMFSTTRELKTRTYDVKTGSETIGAKYDFLSTVRNAFDATQEEIRENEELMQDSKRMVRKRIRKTNENLETQRKHLKNKIYEYETELEEFDPRINRHLPQETFHKQYDNNIYLVDETQKPVYKMSVNGNDNKHPHDIASEVAEKKDIVKEVLQQRLYKQAMSENNYEFASKLAAAHMTDDNKDIYVNEIITHSSKNPVAINKAFKNFNLQGENNRR